MGKNAVTLVKESVVFNPLSVLYQSKGAMYAAKYTLSNILLYDKDGIYAHTGHGWFDGENIQEYSSMSIPTRKPLVRRLKADFSKGEPFILKDGSNSVGAGDTRYMLFIPREDIELEEPVYSKMFGMIFRKLAAKNDPRIAFHHSVKDITADAFGKRLEQYVVSSFAREKLPEASVKSDKEFETAIQQLRNLRARWNEQEKYVAEYTVEDYLAEIAGKDEPRPTVVIKEEK